MVLPFWWESRSLPTFLSPLLGQLDLVRAIFICTNTVFYEKRTEIKKKAQCIIRYIGLFLGLNLIVLVLSLKMNIKKTDIVIF
jgi:hypothetical protein